MAKALAPSKALVNNHVDDGLRHAQRFVMPDEKEPPIVERLRLMIADLEQKEGQKISARALARRAGLASESHVGLILNNKVPNVTSDTLNKLAKVGGVDPGWLLGETEQRRPTKNFEPLSFRAVRLMAASCDMESKFVDEWLKRLPPEEDEPYDGDYLWTQLKAEYARVQRLTKGSK